MGGKNKNYHFTDSGSRELMMKMMMIHSLSSVLRRKDSGVLSGSGGIRLLSPAAVRLNQVSNCKFLYYFFFPVGKKKRSAYCENAAVEVESMGVEVRPMEAEVEPMGVEVEPMGAEVEPMGVGVEPMEAEVGGEDGGVKVYLMQHQNLQLELETSQVNIKAPALNLN